MNSKMELMENYIPAPRKRQLIRIVQMSLHELYDYVTEMSAENPLINIEFRNGKADGEKNSENPLRRKLVDEKNNVYYNTGDVYGQSVDTGFSQYIFIERNNLKDYLLFQLDMLDMSRLDYKVARHIIELIDDDGYLNENISEISSSLNVSRRKAENILALIQSFEPYCVGGRVFIPEQVPCCIIPDVIVACVSDEYKVLHDESLQPQISINIHFLKEIETTICNLPEEYIIDKIEQASWLAKCIEERKRGLLKVCKTIVDLQQDFFKNGPEHLAPLALEDISRRLSIAEIEASRAMRNKFMYCSWGIFEFKYFLRDIKYADN
ncbi:MAG TPA: hypothetical protein GXX14_07950 [Clostridiaceae bacterium]|nr:hypothetical protein [Clostridiaceae bacterium]